VILLGFASIWLISQFPQVKEAKVIPPVLLAVGVAMLLGTDAAKSSVSGQVWKRIKVRYSGPSAVFFGTLGLLLHPPTAGSEKDDDSGGGDGKRDDSSGDDSGSDEAQPDDSTDNVVEPEEEPQLIPPPPKLRPVDVRVEGIGTCPTELVIWIADAGTTHESAEPKQLTNRGPCVFRGAVPTSWESWRFEVDDARYRPNGKLDKIAASAEQPIVLALHRIPPAKWSFSRCVLSNNEPTFLGVYGSFNSARECNAKRQPFADSSRFKVSDCVPRTPNNPCKAKAP
jgi:hypothetical protein